MRVHHLNCGTMRPRAAPGGLVCHVLLIETGNALALVDSGLGLYDADSPGARFGLARHYVRPLFDPAEAAITQIRELGFDPRDVRDIVLTHFDADHVGGLADFPWARVHLTDAEALAARHPRGLVERQRYRPAQRSHTPDLIAYEPTGEAWRGFESARELTAIAPGVVLINLPGHTRGHAAVAVDAGSRWILHAGDAFYHHAQLDGTNAAPLSLTAMERLVAADRSRVRANHQLLKELWSAADPTLMLVNAHDPKLLTRARERFEPVIDLP
ncbi:MBL fold metallo-hydrolase [Nocardia sp. NPDC056000]|uniref:MBL fold metallo-hydrolase n=1 Tax=Nocardia sp. NPDC056000 TaxID=3345674 RepID=UPI0035DE39F3